MVVASASLSKRQSNIWPGLGTGNPSRTYYSSILQYMSNKFVPKHCPVQALPPISFDTHRPHEISKSLKSKIFPFRFKIYQTNPILHQNETFGLPNPHHGGLTFQFHGMNQLSRLNLPYFQLIRKIMCSQCKLPIGTVCTTHDIMIRVEGIQGVQGHVYIHFAEFVSTITSNQ